MGQDERQIYVRSLTDGGYRLIYRRFVDELLERRLNIEFLRQ
jgi:hypothetical protein